MNPLVPFQTSFCGKLLSTIQAAVRSQARVDGDMVDQIAVTTEGHSTLQADMWLFSSVIHQVRLQIGAVYEPLPTLFALMWPLSCMRLHMDFQMTFIYIPLPTMRANVRFVWRVIFPMLLHAF